VYLARLRTGWWTRSEDVVAASPRLGRAWCIATAAVTPSATAGLLVGPGSRRGCCPRRWQSTDIRI